MTSEECLEAYVAYMIDWCEPGVMDDVDPPGIWLKHLAFQKLRQERQATEPETKRD